jgi:surface antigen
VPIVRVAVPDKRGAPDPGDDYPAQLKSLRQDSVQDQWGEYNRECTSFVAWALATRNGFNMPFNDNATGWGPDARRRGYTVNSTPAKGAVAWSPSGHVAYVQDVVGGDVHIEEYNHGYPRNPGTYSTRTVPAGNFQYIHFADLPPGSGRAPLGSATQMVLDGAGQIWAKTGIGNGGWTQETPPSEKAMAAGGNGLQMLLDGAGQVWAKTGVGNGGWTQETPAGERAIAAGGNGLQMLLDGAGQVWAKTAVGNGGWTQETPPGEKAIAAGADGTQMLLDGAGQIWAKTGVGNGGWTQETPAGEHAIAAG